MIIELGHYALVLALIVAITQGTLPLIGAHRRHGGLMALAAPAAMAQLLCVGVAFAALMQAYVTSDFSVANVADNSHTLKPLLYKITGVWGNHEGSMLLWATVLALFGAAVAWRSGSLPKSLAARVLGVQGLLGVGILAFILFTSNPFLRRLPAPLDGNGLNPILQDPGLAFHPPMLYLGYVGFSVTFAFAVAGLLEGRIDGAWARWVRPWALAAWTALTLGIALGSWWAYYDLGWGGWWFWDPVENASFMPWLAGTALLHSAIVVEKRDALKRWTVLLALVTFALSLIGTFLVRSGVLASVHAFAVDPARGVYILSLLVIVIGGSLALYAWRAATLEPGGLFQPISREGALVLNNLLLGTAAATVLLGTLYPLFLGAIGQVVTVGPPYFNATFLPLMTGLVIIMAVGPMLPWKRADLGAALARLKLAAAGFAVVAILVAALTWGGPVLAIPGMALAAWLIIGTLIEWSERIGVTRAGAFERARRLPRAAWGMTLAHLGLGVAIIGMTGTLWKGEAIEALAQGQSLDLAGYHVTLTGIETVRGPNYAAERATLTVTKNGRAIGELTPERRRFVQPAMAVANTSIRTTGWADLYAALGDPDPTGRWVVRLYHNTGAPLIWGGAIIMAFGGLVSLSDRRYRLGTPARRPVGVAEAARG